MCLNFPQLVSKQPCTTNSGSQGNNVPASILDSHIHTTPRYRGLQTPPRVIGTRSLNALSSNDWPIMTLCRLSLPMGSCHGAHGLLGLGLKSGPVGPQALKTLLSQCWQLRRHCLLMKRSFQRTAFRRTRLSPPSAHTAVSAIVAVPTMLYLLIIWTISALCTETKTLRITAMEHN